MSDRYFLIVKLVRVGNEFDDVSEFGVVLSKVFYDPYDAPEELDELSNDIREGIIEWPLSTTRTSGATAPMSNG